MDSSLKSLAEGGTDYWYRAPKSIYEMVPMKRFSILLKLYSQWSSDD